jgi:hypothetical protein
MMTHVHWLKIAAAGALLFSTMPAGHASEAGATRDDACAFNCISLGRINPSREGRQTAPQLARLDDGRFVASWHDSTDRNGRVHARIYDPFARRWGHSFDLNDRPVDVRSSAPLVALSGGKLLAHWWTMAQERDEDGAAIGQQVWDLRLRLFDLSGNGLQPGDERVLWTGPRPGSLRASFVELQGRDADDADRPILLANAATHELTIINRQGHTLGVYPLADPHVSPDHLFVTPTSDGGAHVFWGERDRDLRLARVDSQGRLSVLAARLPGMVSRQSAGFTATELSSGDIAVVWHDNSQHIRFAVISQQGQFVVAPVTASQHDEHSRHAPAIVAMPDGGFTISWTDKIRRESWSLTNPHIHIRRFGADGRPIGIEYNLAIESGNRDSSLLFDHNGNLIISMYSGTGWTRNVYLVECRLQ